jgi:hypothetical protein
MVPIGAFIAALVVAGQYSGAGYRAVTAQASPTLLELQSANMPTPVATPRVTVNGQTVPVGPSGSVHMTLPGGSTHVDVSGGQASVTTDDSSTATAVGPAGGGGNVNVKVDSSVDNGSNWSSTQAYSSSAASGSSTSFSSTNVFSSGSGHFEASSQ